MNDLEMHFLHLIALCRKFLRMPCHAMAWRTLITEKMKEWFGPRNVQITTFSGKSIRKDV